MLKCLAIVVFLTVVLPVDGQQNGPQASDNAKDSKPTNWTVPCTVKKDGSAPDCDWSKAIPDGYFKRLFSPENAPNIALFVVAAIGIVIALFSLEKVKEQTEATEDAAKAARDSAIASLKQANAVVDAERAWLIESIQFVDDVPYRSPEGGILTARVTLRNIGKQPAFLRTVQLRFHGSEDAFPKTPQYFPRQYFPDGFMVAPRGKIYLRAMLEEGSFDDDQVKRIRGITLGKTLRLYLYGRIAYESMGNPGVNQFCYRWENQMGFSFGGDKPGFQKDGPDGYNSHT
jgi:hypothetical protein